MKRVTRKGKHLARSFRVARFLASRQIRRGKVWVTALIVLIMTLTFLSLVVVPGILVGIIEGSTQQRRDQLTGDVFLTPLPHHEAIDRTEDILRLLDSLPEVESYAVRQKGTAEIQSGFIHRDDYTEDADSVSAPVYAISPAQEEKVSTLAKHVVEGDMFKDTDSHVILIGSTLLRKYSTFSDLFEPLRYVESGKDILFSMPQRSGSRNKSGSGPVRDDHSSGTQSFKNWSRFRVTGIVKSKVGDISNAVFIPVGDYYRLTGNRSLEASEILIRRKEGISDEDLKQILLSYGVDRNAKVQTAEEAIPKFLSDVQRTFSLLGNLIGAIGIVVSSITIFIIIYVNAITREKFIGILKGIGVSSTSIELSYVLQSFFYALSGVLLGAVIVYGVLVPFVESHPISFPMSDGVLVASPLGTFLRALILIAVSLLAGYIPAKLITKKNTIDSILQRNT